MTEYRPPTGATPNVNTHYYDAKLCALGDRLAKEAAQTEATHPDILRIVSTMFSNPHARAAVELILQTYEHGSGNYDETNNLDAYWMLSRILQHPRFRDLYPVIQEQLADIVVSGKCPQGRCVRLAQLYLALQK